MADVAPHTTPSRQRAGDERWRRATSEVVSALLTGSDTDALLHVVARAASDLLDGDVATIGTPWVVGRSLRLRVAVGHRAEDLDGAIFPVDESLSGMVLCTGKGMVLDDATSNGNAYQPICELGDMGPTLITPLIAQGEAFGTLLVARRRDSQPFTQQDLDQLESFAGHVALATEFTRARDELSHLDSVKRREQVGRDLHDTVVQHLFAIGLELMSIAAERADIDGSRIEGVAERLDDVIVSIRETVLAPPAEPTSHPSTAGRDPAIDGQSSRR